MVLRYTIRCTIRKCNELDPLNILLLLENLFICPFVMNYTSHRRLGIFIYNFFLLLSLIRKYYLMRKERGNATNRTSARICSIKLRASWHWKLEYHDDKDCGICRSLLDEFCGTCRTPGDDCPVVIGLCKHAFHKHCIETWCLNEEKCPLCRLSWRVLYS